MVSSKLLAFGVWWPDGLVTQWWVLVQYVYNKDFQLKALKAHSTLPSHSFAKIFDSHWGTWILEWSITHSEGGVTCQDGSRHLEPHPSPPTHTHACTHIHKHTHKQTHTHAVAL